MTYDNLLQSNGALKKTVSTEKRLDCECSPSVKQELPVATSTTLTATKLALPYTHKRSKSYNIGFQYNKSTIGLQVNILSNHNHNHSSSIISSSSNQPRKNHSNQAREVPSKQQDAAASPAVDSESMGELEEPPLIQAFFTYFCYTVLRWFGNLRELLRSTGIESRKGAKDNNSDDFPALFSSFENFFMQNFYMRGRDCFNRPICGVPGAEIDLVERRTDDYNWSFYNTGNTRKVLNMASYNYLGFAENTGPVCEDVKHFIRNNGVASCSSRQEVGTLKCHLELEKQVADFLNKEKAIVFGMGFATNSVNIPALVDKNCLILSDELNHTSLILGARLSGAVIQVFKHNQPADLEAKLKRAIIEGHTKTRRAWKKILIVVEGIYSMEGTLLDLPAIVEIKKKYGAYLYLDEAHSIGALGTTGRGICEYWGVDTRDVDVLMGTFSKSFGAAGGYVAASASIIDYLRAKSHAQCYASSMSPAICEQVSRALSIIMDVDGSTNGRNRIRQLKENCVYFRDKLVKMGFIVYGHKHSPIVPVMFYLPTKCLYFNRLMLERNIAVVSVGFPATNLIGGRVRFCISAAHTREMLDRALEAIDECGGNLCMSKISTRNPARSLADVNALLE